MFVGVNIGESICAYVDVGCSVVDFRNDMYKAGTFISVTRNEIRWIHGIVIRHVFVEQVIVSLYTAITCKSDWIVSAKNVK